MYDKENMEVKTERRTDFYFQEDRNKKQDKEDRMNVLKDLLESGKLTKREKIAVRAAYEALEWPQEAALKDIVTDVVSEECPEEIDKSAVMDDVIKKLGENWIDMKLIRNAVETTIKEFVDGQKEWDYERRAG